MGALRSHLQTLKRLSSVGANGEYIAVSDNFEAHIYLQHGRVAWGTSSSIRFGFARYLFESCRIDQASFKDLVKTCRTENRPLGETLIEWELATLADVRRALEHQVLDALRQIADLTAAQTLFLKREGFSKYNAELTFALDELLNKIPPEPEAPSDAPAIAVTARPSDLAEQVTSIAAAMPDAMWVEARAVGAGSYRYPGGTQATIAPLLAPLTVDSGAHFVAIRSGLGTVAGCMLPSQNQSVWCGLGADHTIGNVFAILSTATNLAATSPKPRPMTMSGWSERGERSPSTQSLYEVAERTDELHSVLLLSPDGPWGMTRVGNFEHSIGFARSRLVLLRLEAVPQSLARSSNVDTDALGFSYRSMVIGDPAVWNYAAEIPDGSGRSLWISLDRSHSQGLGWALLAALTRHVTPRRESSQ